jgi:hypothetical protein
LPSSHIRPSHAAGQPFLRRCCESDGDDARPDDEGPVQLNSAAAAAARGLCGSLEALGDPSGWGGAGDFGAIETLDLVYKRTESSDAVLSRGPVGSTNANNFEAKREGARVVSDADDADAVEVERILTEEDGAGGALNRSGSSLPHVPSLVRTLTDLSRRTGQASETASLAWGACTNPSAQAATSGKEGASKERGENSSRVPFGCDGLRNMDLEQLQRDLAYFGRNFVVGAGERSGADAACSSAQQECHYMDNDDEDDDDYDDEDDDDDDGMMSDD